MDASYKKFGLWLLKFAAIFIFIYVGSVAAYGAGYPGGLIDSPFIHKYFYYQQSLREIYLSITSGFFNLLDINTVRLGAVSLFTEKGGISINDACLGFGLFSFWIAFTLADTTPIKVKLGWLFAGLLALFILNTLRMILVLLMMHYKWFNLHQIDHHLIFNILCYLLIFVLLYYYSKWNIYINDEKQSYS